MAVSKIQKATRIDINFEKTWTISSGVYQSTGDIFVAPSDGVLVCNVVHKFNANSTGMRGMATDLLNPDGTLYSGQGEIRLQAAQGSFTGISNTVVRRITKDYKMDAKAFQTSGGNLGLTTIARGVFIPAI